MIEDENENSNNRSFVCISFSSVELLSDYLAADGKFYCKHEKKYNQWNNGVIQIELLRLLLVIRKDSVLQLFCFCFNACTYMSVNACIQ